MNSISSLTPQQLRRAADIRERILSLEGELNQLLGVAFAAPRLGPVAATVVRRKMSAAGRARISAAAKKRWAALRANKPFAAAQPRRKMSPTARRRLSAMAKQRWVAAKAAGRMAL
jgi:hypothetical protein